MNAGSTLAVVGGGRWGRVLLEVLAELSLPFERVVFVSQANAARMAPLVAARRGQGFALVSTIDDLLARHPPRAAIVANAAHGHFATAMRLIEHGAHVLIEKPLVLSSAHARTLLSAAESRDVHVVPGLQLRFCSYVRRFRQCVAPLQNTLTGFSLQWADPAGEIRYGEAKTYDRTIDVAQDVMAHVWSLLTTVLDGEQLTVDAGRGFDAGRRAELEVSCGALRGAVTLARDADSRRRRFAVETSSGATLALDFAVEPGIIHSGDEQLSGDPDWLAGPRPLAAQLTDFVAATKLRQRRDADVRACLESVSFLERASALIRPGP